MQCVQLAWLSQACMRAGFHELNPMHMQTIAKVGELRNKIEGHGVQAVAMAANVLNPMAAVPAAKPMQLWPSLPAGLVSNGQQFFENVPG